MPQLKGLIFDLDGTLLDSAPDLRQALNATLAAHGRRSVSLDEVQSFVGDGMLSMMGRAFAATGAPVTDADSYKMFQEFINNYRVLPADQSQLYPHVKEKVEMYHKAGVKLGICTNKQEAATHRLIADLGMTSLFTFIAGGDTFPVHKPHPDHVRGVITALEVAKEHCVMVGDSSNDVLAARGAGIPCIVVTQGYGVSMEKSQSNPLIPGFKELPQAIEELGFNLG